MLCKAIGTKLLFPNFPSFLKGHKIRTGAVKINHRITGSLITLLGSTLLIVAYVFPELDGLTGKQAFLYYWECWYFGGGITLFGIADYMKI